MVERTRYQEKVIRNYYENRDAISLQRLQELVTELYLAEGKAKAKHWKNITAVLEKLKIPADRIQHLVQKDNPALVAKLVEELIAKEK
jgi:heme oxygenase